jgi:hypothetical protein
MKKISIVISDNPDCRIVLLHYTDDPSAWIIRKWVRKGFLRRRTESKWFNSRDLAEVYARKLSSDCAKSR